MIGRSPAGLEWIEWAGDDTDDPVLDADHRYEGCDQNTQCAYVWEVKPTKSGLHDIRARGRDKNGVRSEWTVVHLRIREGPTPTNTPVPTVGPGTPTPTPITQPVVKLNLDDSGRFKESHVLRSEFDALLASREPHQIVHQCGSGVTACHNLLAMEHAGLTGSRLYAGSWSEWISDRSRPIE